MSLIEMSEVKQAGEDRLRRLQGSLNCGSNPTPLRERGQSETVRERGGSDYKQSSDCGDEESKPFMSSDDLEKELYDPKGSKPNATARFMPRFDGIQRDTPRRRLCEGNTCSAKSVCRGCCVLTLLVILLLWLWIAVDRLHSDERREQLLLFLQESPIHPVETGVMVDTWSDHPPTLHSSCPLLYTLSAAKAKTYGLSLAEEELQLLGTLMVRICKCVCPFQLPESATQLAGHLPGHRVLRVCDESAGTVAEILRGANVVVDGDGGWYYRWFQRMQDAYKRTSSHYSVLPTYGVPEGQLLRTVLTGVDVFRDSWFQLEGGKWSITRHPFESMVHAMNYIEYKITGEQIGPLGKSGHTDKLPMRIPFDGCVLQAEVDQYT